MNQNYDCLFELGSEELPPHSLEKLSLSLQHNITENLKEKNLNFTEVAAFATPRRLSVLIKGLAAMQPNQELELKGPKKQISFNADGSPTHALEGFMKKAGVTDIKNLYEIQSGKGVGLAYKKKQVGAAAVTLLSEIINSALKKLPIEKRMFWGDAKYEFIRPVHWIVLIYGDKIVDSEFFGIKTTNKTYGHRFHSPKAVVIDKPCNYEKVLEQKFVIADFAKRKNLIKDQINKLALETNVNLHLNESLLNEVTAINEYPQAFIGSFDESFLSIPKEALIASMESHQKYFPLTNANGNLINKFIFVANIKSIKPESLIKGNEKVLRPRLADASFFWEQGKKIPLDSYNLESVIFQKDLGTLADKIDRIKAICQLLIKQLPAFLTLKETQLLPEAVKLCKKDLLSDLVGEFPELQGIAGKYFALEQGVDTQVAQAIEEHYKPKAFEDVIPSSNLSTILALADKFDSLFSLFAINLAPKGDKDPFALRRASFGIIKIILEKSLELNLEVLIAEYLHEVLKIKLTSKQEEIKADDIKHNEINLKVREFIFVRLESVYQTAGYTKEEISAITATISSSILDFDIKIKAISRIKKEANLTDFLSLYKRVNNLLKPNKLKDKSKNKLKLIESLDVLVETYKNKTSHKLEEQVLDKIQEALPNFCSSLADKDYLRSFKALSSLVAVYTEFLDELQVNTDDENIQFMRFSFLNCFKVASLQIADFTKI